MPHIEAEGSKSRENNEEGDIEIYHMFLLCPENGSYLMNLSRFKVSIKTILIPVAVETRFSSK
jgi:hypothetical protein